MILEKAVLAALNEIESIRGKVYPAEVLKNAAAPFAFYRQIGEDEEADLAGGTGLESASFEIHCVSTTYAGLVSLSGEVRLALKALQGQIIDGLLIERAKVRQASPDLNEKEVGMMRRVYILQLDYQGGNENE